MLVLANSRRASWFFTSLARYWVEARQTRFGAWAFARLLLSSSDQGVGQARVCRGHFWRPPLCPARPPMRPRLAHECSTYVCVPMIKGRFLQILGLGARRADTEHAGQTRSPPRPKAVMPFRMAVRRPALRRCLIAWPDFYIFSLGQQ